MRKKALLLLLFFSLLLSSCSIRTERGAKTFYDLLEKTMTVPNCEIYSFVSDASHNTLLSRLYQGKAEEEAPKALMYCRDYLICLYHTEDVLWELHIFCTVSLYDNEKVEEMLRNRRDLLQKSENSVFYEEKTKERVSSAALFTRSDFVVLAVTDENQTVLRLLEELV